MADGDACPGCGETPTSVDVMHSRRIVQYACGTEHTIAAHGGGHWKRSDYCEWNSEVSNAAGESD